MLRNRWFFFLGALAVLALSVEAQPKSAKSTDGKLKGAERLRFDVLALILDEAGETNERTERARRLAEYLDESAAFVRDHPNSLGVWTGRAQAAAELNRAQAAWSAGREMIRLRAEKVEDPHVRRALAMLDRRGWLGDEAPHVGPREGEPWENSLGMRFVPVPGTAALFSIWETRVRDFTTFVETTGYDATSGLLSFDPADSTWARKGASWRLPGFDQSAEHPVVGVNWHDAKAFCAWLTQEERQAGVIADDQEYRLPHDAEWSIAAGGETYAWGATWPPPADAGNFLGEEARPTPLRVLETYHDGAARTAPVGRFAPNRFGLWDLSGNVEEWCEDAPPDASDPGKFRHLRGASWSYQSPSSLRVDQRHRAEAGQRIDDVGFRCVLGTRVGPAPVAPPRGELVAAPGLAAPLLAAVPVPMATSPPRAIHQVEPEYPYAIRVQNGSGIVVVEFTIDETGRVRDPRVVSTTDSAFKAPALAAMNEWRFDPARKDGQPVAQRVMQELRFNAAPAVAARTP